MIIELKGVEFENKGAELMLRAVLQRIQMYWPHAQIAMTPSPKAPYLLRASVGAWQKISLRKLYLDLNSASYFMPALLSRFFRRWGLVTEADIDVVIDASGFSYSDQWGPKMSIRHLAGELNRNHQHGKPYIFMPQAFGPFTDPKVRDQIKQSFPLAALVCAREADSFNHLFDITGEQSNLKQFGDFTNAVVGIVPEYLDRSTPLACIIPNKNMVNPRNKNGAWLATYEQTLLMAIDIYQQLGLTPFFLNHEGVEDGALITKLNSQLAKPLLVITEPDPLQVKGIISASHAVLCSRFHGCVSALSNGIACLSTSWSHKYERLYDDYQASSLLLKPDVSRVELQDIIQLSLATDNDLHRQIKTNALHYKQQTETLWLQVKEIIDQVKA